MAGRLDVCLVRSSPIALDVAFTCGAGEVVALLGPSGSGKTTTLRAIAGLVTPHAGHVRLGDDTWFDAARGVCLRPEARRVGFVFQDYALFPHLNVLGNVTLAMGQVDAAERSTRARSILDRLGIADLATRQPRELSGGERQRVGIARALARDPHVLLLDEPFSAVDRPTRRKLEAQVLALVTSVAIPVVLVTHDIEEAAALASRLIIIDGGKTIAEGLPATLLSDPPTVRVAEIIGT